MIIATTDVRIVGYERLPNSRYGNPCYRFRTDTGAYYTTAADTGWAYEVVPSRTLGTRQRFALNRTGRIVSGVTL